MPAKRSDPIVRPVRVKDGVVFLSDGTQRGEDSARKMLRAALKHFPDGAYEWELRPFLETRTAKANAWLWAVVYHLIAMEMCGIASKQAKDDVHELMKARHNSKTVAGLDGQETRIPQSTASLKIQDFSDYIDACMLDGAEVFGIMWPEPRERDDWRISTRKGRAA